ncbi:similar to Kazachstania naganishii KNAG_0L01210 hypothetical protein [Maudiozyma saulgeensis]|uniref:BHLH domain-containing protein n=1 Tax=Maudiozyma saulgeensis TaxID=1789683 RepID=A0A1X7R351_9SACH|nr:similar to Kazachstania naganishii KNAG_0L01210 hypothetical protein [Kazachstania saulgeensis]
MQFMNMNHSKSILDQVDEYLHDNNDPHSTHITFMESEKEPMNNVQLYSNNWLTDDIQLDLDHIGETFFNNGNNNNSNSNSNNSTNRMNGHDLHLNSHSSMGGIHGNIDNQHSSIGKVNDPEMNGGFTLMEHSMKQNDNTTNLLNKNSHFSNIQSDLVFSPSASPLVAPGQSAIGLQVTPFMNPQVLIGTNSNNVSNMNTPYLRESAVPSGSSNSNTTTNNNNAVLHNSSATTTPHVSHYSPLSSPAVNEHNQSYSSTNFTLPASAVEEPIANGGNTSTNSGNGSKTSKGKRTSSSSRSKRISFSSSNGNSAKQTFNGSSSKVRKNSPYMSANRSRRNYQELKTKNGTTVNNGNNDSAGNTPIGNNSTTPTNASWDDMVFKLPESSTTAMSISDGTNSDAPDSGSKESSLTASQFAVASKILPSSSYPGQGLPNGIGTEGNAVSKRIEIPLQTSIETTESWKQKANSDRSRSSNSLSSNGTSPKNGKNGINNVGISPLMKARKSSKTNGDTGSTTSLTRTKSRSSESRSGKKDDTKKEVHKVAEQERRNRLNSALNELSGLIPEDLKEMISIPSKATTAELACVYIRSLQKRVQELEQDRNH